VPRDGSGTAIAERRAVSREALVMHLGWFVGRGYSVHAWNQPWSGTIGADWAEGGLLLDAARAMDRARFDYLLIEDGSFVPDTHRGSAEWHMRNAATVPKLDPMPLVPLLGQATTGLGIVPTMCAAFYPPYLAARLAVTLDHLTHGRLGLNLVTAHNDRTAQNFGLERHHEHDLRYEMADEWMDVVNQLWASWQPDAILDDAETGVFADHRKVHPIDFAGRYYKSRGPLNAPPGPQGRPVICQAGGSPAGIAFAAKHAETIVARVRGIARAKAHRAEITAHLAKHGRDPASCKVMFCTAVVLGETIEEARERKARIDRTLAENLEPRLAQLSFLSGIDFSRFDLDAPLPEINTNASRTLTMLYTYGTGAKTLREALSDPSSGGVDFVGTPDRVAAEMGDAIAEIGGDGFMITEGLTRRSIAEMTDGLATALKRRGLMRPVYRHQRFRDNLLEF
jgi:FMN-dependent oxidoreductase (nitrilotriacetate monooxygenase family)